MQINGRSGVFGNECFRCVLNVKHDKINGHWCYVCVLVCVCVSLFVYLDVYKYKIVCVCVYRFLCARAYATARHVSTERRASEPFRCFVVA